MFLFFALGAIGYLISLFNSLIQVRDNIGKALRKIQGRGAGEGQVRKKTPNWIRMPERTP